MLAGSHNAGNQKDSLAVTGTTLHFHRFTYMKLKSLLLFCLAAVVAAAGSGCNLLRKSKKPKENPAIASEVEGEFRQRWVDHRAAELVAKGTDALTARSQADTEFRERYPYVKPPKK